MIDIMIDIMIGIKDMTEVKNPVFRGLELKDLITMAISTFIPIIVACIALKGVKDTIQNNINSNLRANARIEWIQKVRNTSAELISLYYYIISYKDSDSKNKDELYKALVESRLKTELLIMYFGPNTKNKNHKDSTEIILNIECNEGKNDSIVVFLSDLNMDFHKFYRLKFNSAESIYSQTRRRIMIEQKIKKSNVDLEERLIKLRNIIRIYLKVEWDKAKEGK